MVQGGAITLSPFFINSNMAVPIIKASSVPSLRKYVAMAIIMFGETEPIPVITNRTTGDITYIDPADVRNKDKLLKQLANLVFVEDVKVARQQLDSITFTSINDKYSVAYLV